MAKNLCLPNGGCSHRCDQGRDCEGSRTATCLAVGLPFLASCEGGMRVSGDDSVRLNSDRCSVCAGRTCSTPEACQLPIERESERRTRIPLKAWAFIGAITGSVAAACVIARFPV